MRSERVTRAEVIAAIRAGGKADLNEVGAVVLETDGSFTVLPRMESSGRSVLGTVDCGGR